MIPHEKAVEAAVIAGSRSYDEGIDAFDEQYIAAISAYLASMEAQGWVMVPREPTEAMTNAVPAVHHESFKAIWPKICADVYRAKLAAKEAQP